MKPSIRVDKQAKRREVDSFERDIQRISRVLTHLKAMNPSVVACYVSVGSEPDTTALLGELVDWGLGILLPYLLSGSSSTPLWSRWAGEPMVSGWFGIPTPTIAEAPEVLYEADVIIMPGLAGTPSGARLGTGGGWYDRALLHARPEVPRWLLLNDDEVIDSLPQDPWDQPVTAVVTESRWIEVSSTG